jgi:hypothetical protein
MKADDTCCPSESRPERCDWAKTEAAREGGPALLRDVCDRFGRCGVAGRDRFAAVATGADTCPLSLLSASNTCSEWLSGFPQVSRGCDAEVPGLCEGCPFSIELRRKVVSETQVVVVSCRQKPGKPAKDDACGSERAGRAASCAAAPPDGPRAEVSSQSTNYRAHASCHASISLSASIF